MRALRRLETRRQALNDHRILLNKILGSRTVAYKPVLARLLDNDVPAAILLSQLFWYDGDARISGDPGDPFHVTIDQLELETGLSDKVQRRVRKLLKDAGVISFKRRGVPARLFYELKVDALAALAAGQLELDLDTPKGRVLILPKGGSGSAQGEGQATPKGRVSNRGSKKPPQKPKKKRARKRTPADDMTDVICEICQVDIKTTAPSVGKVRTVLMKAGYTPPDVQAFGRWWKKYGFPKGKPPTIWKLKEQIGVIKKEAPSAEAKRLQAEANVGRKLGGSKR